MGRSETRDEKNARIRKKQATRAQNKEDAARATLRQATGGKPARTAIDDLTSRINEARWRYDEIEEQLQKVSQNGADLKSRKKKNDDKSVFGVDEAVQEGGEKLVEQAPVRYLDKKATERATNKATTEAAKRELAKKGVKSVGGRIVGWASLFGDLLEYGGKKYIKRDVSQTLQQYITQNSITETQLIRLQIKLQQAINRDNATIDRILKLKKAYDKAFEASAFANKRAQDAADRLKPATRRATTRRVFDHAGDEEEKRLVEKKKRQDAKKKARVELVPERKRARPTKKRRGKATRRDRRANYHNSHFKGRYKRRGRARPKPRRGHPPQRKASSLGVSIGVSVGGVSISF